MELMGWSSVLWDGVDGMELMGWSSVLWDGVDGMELRNTLTNAQVSKKLLHASKANQCELHIQFNSSLFVQSFLRYNRCKALYKWSVVCLTLYALCINLERGTKVERESAIENKRANATEETG